MNRRTALVLAAAIGIAVAVHPSHDAVGGSKNKAGIVVRNADGTTDEMCVFFDEPSITGLDLLNRSGTAYVAEESAVGSAICKLDAGGCGYPSEDCFCEYPEFWGYWIREPGDAEFAFASTGAADREVRDGAVDGWSWGKDGKPAPPDVPFADVCAAKNVVSAPPAAASSPSPVAADRATETRPNYGAFMAFAALFAALAGGVVLLRRRRAG